MKIQNKLILWGTLAVLTCTARLPLQAATQPSIGPIEPAKQLIGKQVRNLQNEQVGKVDDLVVDLESGRTIYALLSADNSLGIGNVRLAVPTELLSKSNQNFVINADKQMLANAPRLPKEKENEIANTSIASEVYRHFNQSTWWEGGGAGASPTFGNVHKATDLFGMSVQNVANESLGKVDNLAVDLPAARVTYVLLSLGGILNQDKNLYVLPPNAFTMGQDPKTLVTGVDTTKMASAPRVPQNNLTQLAQPAFAARVYQFYGKQPYWAATLSPTGRTNAVPGFQTNRVPRIPQR